MSRATTSEVFCSDLQAISTVQAASGLPCSGEVIRAKRRLQNAHKAIHSAKSTCEQPLTISKSNTVGIYGKSAMTPAAEEQSGATTINDNRLLAVLLIAAALFIVICWRMLGHGNSVNSNQLVYRDGKLLFHEGMVQESPLSTSPCDRELPAHLSQVFFQPVPINSASRELLMILPGIGESMAERIIVTRQQQGRFTSTSGLASVPGLGPKRLAQLQEHICFD